MPTSTSTSHCPWLAHVLRCCTVLLLAASSACTQKQSPDVPTSTSSTGTASPTRSATQNAAAWQNLRTLQGHSAGVNAIAISPDGSMALSGSRDNTMRLWRLDSSALLRTFAGHDDKVRAVAFSPNGAFALSASYDRTVRLWGKP
ncbi:MAG: hypothetical protein KBD96_02480 [Brachymonas sp.]|nr:hypothetical protein [Brachymonas sp.]MBP6139054.1 hypothetical protein [Brachymonas sp.]MBP6967214.1 hypothetical protein [Brachymonas sp.]MBP7247364.1 hypothetical protein [Brachymonas sp.]MBP7744382.1 hypothetical protein [Brachymonas sp.]